MSKIKVLSIVGPGRSGTTVLAAILGEVDGIVDVGELRWLWRRGLLERRTCGCGEPVDECPFWSAVVAKTMAGRTETAGELAREMAAAQGVLSSRRRRLRVIRYGATGTHWPPLEPVRTITEHLVRSVAEVSGARVVVDSSKRAQDAAVLAALDGVEHYVLHMVRDPRAVAFSWGRKDKTIRVATGTRPMGTRGLLSSMTRWTENGLGATVLRQHVSPDRWIFLRYEEFATRPQEAVSRVLSVLGEDGPLPFVTKDTVVLGVNHTVAGNPNRFRVGDVKISLDSAWSQRMPRSRQLLVLAFTWPLLLLYRSRHHGRTAGSPAHGPGRNPATTRFTRRAWRATGSDVRRRR